MLRFLIQILVRPARKSSFSRKLTTQVNRCVCFYPFSEHRKSNTITKLTLSPRVAGGRGQGEGGVLICRAATHLISIMA